MNLEYGWVSSKFCLEWMSFLAATIRVFPAFILKCNLLKVHCVSSDELQLNMVILMFTLERSFANELQTLSGYRCLIFARSSLLKQKSKGLLPLTWVTRNPVNEETDQINSAPFLKVSWFLCSCIHSVKVHIHDPLCSLKSQDGCQVFANAENIIKHTSLYGKYNN